MVKLFEFLEKDDPLRQSIERRKPGSSHNALTHRPNQPGLMLYLTTKTFFNDKRTRVMQEFAGETPSEILIYLRKKFSQSDIDDLLQGIQVESEDGVRQYLLQPKLPKSELGDIRPKKPKKSRTAAFKARCLRSVFGLEGGIREADHLGYLEAAEILRREIP